MAQAKASSKPDLDTIRHSLAHVMAAAVAQLYSKAQFGVGPTVADGFYYDVFLAEQTLSEEDFATIEAKMRDIIAAGEEFAREEWPIAKARQYFTEHNQSFKVELLNDLEQHGTTKKGEIDARELGLSDGGNKSDAKVTIVSVYRTGDFVDLCRGPHVKNTAELKDAAFKLTRVSGAYWRGDETAAQMQRIYGLAFASQDELERYEQMLEEAKKRDHRKLGRELDLFVFSDLVGSGLPLFTPRGTILREELNNYSQQLRLDEGFERVWIPHLTRQELYEKSGHWAKFGDELFLVKSQETSDKLVLKPMNCPHHAQIYASRPRSYRELPLKYLETTTVYRDEKSGELQGLSRVRSITQDDSHVFCTPEQIKDILSMLTRITQQFYAAIDMKLRARLSYHDDSDAYLGDPQLWQRAQAILREVAEENKLDFFEAEGEAAFYGPKIDFMATDALGREHQLATPQLDFVQPQRFGLSYTAADGSAQTPVMIHFALLGSIERFLSVYIEHTGGAIPVWLAPEQVRVIPVSDKVSDYAAKVAAELAENGLRWRLDDSGESLGKRIREAELMKVPYTLVVGAKEAEAGSVAVRHWRDGDLGARPMADFLATVNEQIYERQA